MDKTLVSSVVVVVAALVASVYGVEVAAEEQAALVEAIAGTVAGVAGVVAVVRGVVLRAKAKADEPA